MSAKPPVKPPNPLPVPNQSKTLAASSTPLIGRMQRFARDALGVALVAFALMTLLALVLPELTRGVLLAGWANLLWVWLGWGCVWIVIAAAVSGLWLLRQREGAAPGEPLRMRWGRIFALEIAAIVSLALLSALGGASLARAEGGLDGGHDPDAQGPAGSFAKAVLADPVGGVFALYEEPGRRGERCAA